MRCKNCGFENDDKLFICENCGSPLYDEDEPVVSTDNDPTQVVNSQAVNAYNGVNNQNPSVPPQEPNDDDKKKKQTAIIIVLMIILFIVVCGVVFGIVKSTAKNEPTTATSTSTTQAVTSTTDKSTTKPTETTSQASFAVGVSCNAGGSVSGDGIYKLGENVTVVAKVDDGYNFDGWYKGSTKVSSNTKYTFTVTENISLKAVFTVIETETTTQEQPTTPTEPVTVE